MTLLWEIGCFRVVHVSEQITRSTVCGVGIWLAGIGGTGGSYCWGWIMLLCGTSVMQLRGAMGLASCNKCLVVSCALSTDWVMLMGKMLNLSLFCSPEIVRWPVPSSKITSWDLITLLVCQSYSLYPSRPWYPIRTYLIEVWLIFDGSVSFGTLAYAVHPNSRRCNTFCLSHVHFSAGILSGCQDEGNKFLVSTW